MKKIIKLAIGIVLMSCAKDSVTPVVASGSFTFDAVTYSNKVITEPYGDVVTIKDKNIATYFRVGGLTKTIGNYKFNDWKTSGAFDLNGYMQLADTLHFANDKSYYSVGGTLNRTTDRSFTFSCLMQLYCADLNCSVTQYTVTGGAKY